MGFTIITDQLKEYFASMDPFSLLQVKYPIKTMFVGEYIEDDELQSDIPVALAIMTWTNSELEILWMCVEQSYRGMGYGEKLLDHIAALAEENEKEYIVAHFLKIIGRITYCRGEREYFCDKGFEQTQDDKPDCLNIKTSDYLSGKKANCVRAKLFDSVKEKTPVRYLKDGVGTPITLAQLEKNSLFDVKINTDRVSSMGDADFLKLDKLFAICKKNGGLGLLADLGENLDLNVVDLDLSCFIKEGDTPEVMLLILNPEPNLLIPAIFRSFSTKYGKELMLLMRYAYERALEKYPPYARIIFRRFDEKSNKLVDMVLSNQKVSKSEYEYQDFIDELEYFKEPSQEYSFGYDGRQWSSSIVYRRLKNPSKSVVSNIAEDYTDESDVLSNDEETYIIIALDTSSGKILGSTLVVCESSVHRIIYFEVKEGFAFDKVAAVLFTGLTRLADQKNVQVMQTIIGENQEQKRTIFNLLGFEEKNSGVLELRKIGLL